MAHQGYRQYIPWGATTPFGSACRMGVPERGGGKKAVYSDTSANEDNSFQNHIH